MDRGVEVPTIELRAGTWFELREYMVTPPLKKHPGLIALSLLAATIAVVWTTRPRQPRSAVERPKPQVSIPTTTTPERPSLKSLELTARPVQIAVVSERAFPLQVTASGPISFDESRTSHVTAPVVGLMQKTAHGRTVRAGETVGVIYSLEVYVAALDLIAQTRDFRSQAQLDEARQRLSRWGMRRELVARIEQTLKPQAALPLIAGVSGTVVTEKPLPAPFVEPTGEDLFTITDPSYAWLYVELPADEAELARLGMTARVTIEGIGPPVSAPIGYISRRATEGKRVVRFDLHSAELRMPPTVQAKVDLQLGTARGPAIAESAIIRDDARTFVYVVSESRMEPREVKLGLSKDGVYLVKTGLAAGETIVVDGSHLAPSN